MILRSFTTRQDSRFSSVTPPPQELKAITGDSQRIDEVIARAEGLVPPIESIPFDLFDKRYQTSWGAAISSFNAAVAEVDQLAQSFIDGSFKKLRSAEGAFLLLQKFRVGGVIYVLISGLVRISTILSHSHSLECWVSWVNWPANERKIHCMLSGFCCFFRIEWYLLVEFTHPRTSFVNTARKLTLLPTSLCKTRFAPLLLATPSTFLEYAIITPSGGPPGQSISQPPARCWSGLLVTWSLLSNQSGLHLFLWLILIIHHFATIWQNSAQWYFLSRAVTCPSPKKLKPSRGSTSLSPVLWRFVPPWVIIMNYLSCFQSQLNRLTPQDFETHALAQWHQSVDASALPHLKTPILVEKDGALCVNFSPELKALVHETRHLDRWAALGEYRPLPFLQYISITLQTWRCSTRSGAQRDAPRRQVPRLCPSADRYAAELRLRYCAHCLMSWYVLFIAAPPPPLLWRFQASLTPDEATVLSTQISDLRKVLKPGMRWAWFLSLNLTPYPPLIPRLDFLELDVPCYSRLPCQSGGSVYFPDCPTFLLTV